MKIIHLIDYFQPQIGYQETFLAREHAKAGNQVHVVTSDRYFPFPDYQNTYLELLGSRFVGTGEKNEEGINVLRLKSWEFPGTNIIYLSGLGKVLQKIKPDLVLCHGVYSFTSFLVSKLKNQFGFKLIYDNHAALFNTDFNKSFSRKFYHFFYKSFFASSIINNSDKIFAIGEAEQNFICNDLKIPKKNIPIIRLGVDTDLFKYSKSTRIKLRSKYKISNNKTVVIFTGKITQNKDVHILVSALEKITKFKMTLLLVGNGPPEYLDTLKKLARNTEIIHVTFTENKKLPLYFNVADIAVYPGDFSISVFEAMSSGLPVIIPTWFGSTDLKKSGGIVSFKRGDSRRLFKNLYSIVYNKSLSGDLGRKNTDFIRKYYSWKIIAKTTLEIL